MVVIEVVAIDVDGMTIGWFPIELLGRALVVVGLWEAPTNFEVERRRIVPL